MGALHQRETNLAVVELLDVRTTALAGGNSFDLNDLDSVRASTMTSAHIPVALRDGITNGQITVFAVHVVRTRTRIVTQPDAKVLDLGRRTLVDLLDVDDFAGGLLELLQLTQEVPETRLGDNAIGRKDSHLVERSGGLLLCRQLAADHLVFLQLLVVDGGGEKIWALDKNAF